MELESMVVEESYTGPRMKGSQEEGYTLDLDFVKAMLKEFKEQRLGKEFKEQRFKERGRKEEGQGC